MAALLPILSFLAYFAGGCALSAVFIMLYSNFTPHRELALIRSGNVAAAIAVAGGLLGFVIPLASVIAHSGSLLDLLFWGILALAIQIGGFLVTRLVLPGLPRAIEDGVISDAILLAGISLVLGILDAACMVG